MNIKETLKTEILSDCICTKEKAWCPYRKDRKDGTNCTMPLEVILKRGSCPYRKNRDMQEQPRNLSWWL